MQSITLSEINEFDRLYRINLINSIAGYKAANLIGTINSKGIHNLAIFSSVIHIGSSPPLLAMVTRPDSVPRDTLENIRTSGQYTINHVHKNIYREAHHTSAKYPADISEFDMSGLTPEIMESYKAPFVKESYVKIAMELRDEVPLKINGTILIIGEIQEIFIAPEFINFDGTLKINELNTVTISGLDTYHSVQKLEQLSYARAKSRED